MQFRVSFRHCRAILALLLLNFWAWQTVRCPRHIQDIGLGAHLAAKNSTGTNLVPLVLQLLVEGLGTNPRAAGIFNILQQYLKLRQTSVMPIWFPTSSMNCRRFASDCQKYRFRGRLAIAMLPLSGALLGLSRKSRLVRRKLMITAVSLSPV